MCYIATARSFCCETYISQRSGEKSKNFLALDFGKYIDGCAEQ